jgi:small neutral amino acid transporter SnatA (MarC family)
VHFDLAHTVVLIVALVVTKLFMSVTGLVSEEERKQISWKLVLAYFVVILVVNMMWSH